MRLRFQKRALEQIERALIYVADQSPQGAARIEGRMTAMLALVQLLPRTGSRTRIPNVRRVFLTPYPYLIDYFVGEDEIVVQRFRHTSRRPIA